MWHTITKQANSTQLSGFWVLLQRRTKSKALHDVNVHWKSGLRKCEPYLCWANLKIHKMLLCAAHKSLARPLGSLRFTQYLCVVWAWVWCGEGCGGWMCRECEYMHVWVPVCIILQLSIIGQRSVHLKGSIINIQMKLSTPWKHGINWTS